MTADDYAAEIWAKVLSNGQTASARLAALAGTTGTAATLLMAIGTGATAGAILVNYSGLASATAEQHLLADRVIDHPEPGFGGVHRPYARRRRPDQVYFALLH